MIDVQWGNERVNETRTTNQFERNAENRFNNLAEQDVNMRTTCYIVQLVFFFRLQLVSLFEWRLTVSAPHTFLCRTHDRLPVLYCIRHPNCFIIIHKKRHNRRKTERREKKYKWKRATTEMEWSWTEKKRVTCVSDATNWELQMKLMYGCAIAIGVRTDEKACLALTWCRQRDDTV